MAIDSTELVDGDVLTLGQVGVTVQESAGGVALTENIGPSRVLVHHPPEGGCAA